MAGQQDTLWQIAQILQGAEKERVQDRDRLTQIERNLRDIMGRVLPRENAHYQINHDTGSTAMKRHHVPSITGGAAGLSLSFHSIPSGAVVEVAINGEPFIEVTEATNLDNETIETLDIRATTTASGTMRVRVGAYNGA